MKEKEEKNVNEEENRNRRIWKKIGEKKNNKREDLTTKLRNK